MASIHVVIDSAKLKAEELAKKVKEFDKDAFVEEVKAIDTGVLLTMAEDAVAKLDVEGKKQAVKDFIDSPTTAALKEKLYLLKDFVGYVPYYAQSVPTMVKEAIEKVKK